VLDLRSLEKDASTMTTMTTNVVRKVATEGIGYSIVELNDVRHVFAAAVPRYGHTLEEQAHDALRTIEAVIDTEGAHGTIVHQAVFVADPDSIQPCRQVHGHSNGRDRFQCENCETRRSCCRQLIREFYGDELPATSYIPQRPCEGKLLAIEALGVGRGEKEVQIDRIDEGLVVAAHNGISWVHCAQIVPQCESTGVYDRSLSAFSAMRAHLAQAGLRFDQIIRTWLYLGDIVGPEGETQRYKELNRARTDFFKGIDFLVDRLPARPHHAVFPASTGIGADGQDVMMSCIALATDRKDILAVPLENPRQTSAFDYASSYSPKSPKFARAMALSCGNMATIFVSGTASITQSETRHIDNAAAQTHETLDNIAALIGEDNLAQHGLPGLGTTLDNLALVRVYIKRQEDYKHVRAVCEARLDDLPTVYAIADVCRPELLVEIEGIAFSRQD
jgi:enamine deaminase RidA (YjgF/YER057c/UK114 family)